jgi:stage V sporulation protein D (sporulation-specific penicillin-binding protein)
MAITFLFLFIIGRYFYVQILWRDWLLYKALDQWTRELPIVASRGIITDRNGTPLVENTTRYTVFARSNAVKEKEKTAKLLVQTLGGNETDVYEKLTKVKASEVTVAKRVEKEKVSSLAQLALDGVYYSRDNLRSYPCGASLCQVLGFTSSDNVGVTGLEKYYDDYLKGKRGELLYETDLVGIELDGAVAAYVPAEDGYNLSLTIDYGIQTVVESTLRKVAEEHQPAGAECIVLDPNTFEILAIANYPAYDLNEIPRDDIETLNKLSRNRIVSDVYEPGSTFKVITAAINIEEHLKGNQKAYSIKHIFPSSRTRAVDGTTVKCWNNHANGKHANQTLADALHNSCNPCFTDIALSVGKTTFYDYLSSFGLGKRSGIDFSGEAYGLLMPESAVRNCDLARIGFGQTVAVTGLQLALATASAINGGYYYRPRLVKKIYANDGFVKENHQPELKNRTVSEETSKLLTGMLEGVVKDGSGKKAYIEGYRVGGKTGVANINSGMIY